MTQKDKDLLLKDLSSRLFYGVKIKIEVPDFHFSDTEVLKCIDENCANVSWLLSEVKPYLFPMSSMTSEQLHQSINIRAKSKTCEWIDWLNEHHFDYRGLIERGLAIDATNLNIY